MLGSEEQACEKRLALRMAVIDTAREMNRRGINVNKSGNVSARTSGGRSFFITPTGIPYESLEPDDIVEVSLDAERFEGRCLPSSEWVMHAEIYRIRAMQLRWLVRIFRYQHSTIWWLLPEVVQSMWLRMPLLALTN